MILLLTVFLQLIVQPSVADVCDTAGCVEAAAHILSTYDPTADPCEDFYQFACGKWLADNDIPDDKSSYGAFTQVSERVTAQMKQLLANDIPLSFESVAVNMTRQVYRECINTTKLAQLKSDVVWKILTKLGGMPLLTPNWNGDKFNYNLMLATVKGDYLVDPMFNVGVGVDDRNVSRNIIQLGETGLQLGSRDYYLNDTTYGKQITAYKKYIEDIMQLIAADASITVPKDFKEQIDQIVDFERKIANLTLPPEETRNSSKLYHKYTFNQLKKLTPEINWDNYLTTTVPKDVLTLLTDDAELVVSVPDYIVEIGKLLKQTDSKILANFFLWNVVSSTVGHLDERFGDAYQVLAKTLYGREKKPLRWKECVDAARGTLDLAAGAIYVDKHFDAVDKKEVEQMVANLLSTMSDLIKELDWMDNETKSAALEKVANMITFLGYPNATKNATALDAYYKELKFADDDTYVELGIKTSVWSVRKNYRDLLKPFDRYRFESDAAVVNAYYNPSTNGIVFPAGILQPPFFKASYPKYINYGAVGSVIGHEITHGFDDEGSQYDKTGKLANWWTEKAAAAFKERVKCIIDQYSGYQVKDIKKNVNGEITQGENVADSGGVKETYRAYQSYLASTGKVEPSLPGLNFTNDQAFFVSFAQFWCNKDKPQAALDNILGDSHSPTQFRVIGTLSNTKEFATAFNCSATAALNPAKRCKVW